MLSLGFTAFGGPAAHIAMLEDEVVTRRRWMSTQHFLDLIGATSLIPGPNSTEMVLHIGYERRGFPGLVVAGLCFILPSMLLTLLCAIFYQRYGSVPQAQPALMGLQATVMVILILAIRKLGRKAIKGWKTAALGSLAVAALLAGVDELTTLAVGAALGTVLLRLDHRGVTASGLGALGLGLSMPASASGVTAGGVAAGGVAAAAAAPTLASLGWLFLKVGAVLYGSGYVLVAFLEGDFVSARGWLTDQQLLDAIAFGQLTPGPVLTTATFIGYLLLGIPGAIVATAAIFLPSFLFVTLLNPWVPKLRKSPTSAAFLDAVNAVAMGLMVAVWIHLAWINLRDPVSLGIAAIIALLALWKSPSSMWLVGLGALLGALSGLL
ncbi:MAG: chromate efflux transporter [Acidobacteriota bacterium]